VLGIAHRSSVAACPLSHKRPPRPTGAGTFDLDAELDLWFSGLGKVRLEFTGSADIRQLGQMIATYVL
jgi:hypothetical protein